MVPFPAILRDESGSLTKAVFCNSIGSETAIRHGQVDRLPPVQEFFDKLLTQFVDLGLQLLHLSARKGFVCCTAADTMDFVIFAAKTGMFKRTGSGIQEMLLLVTDAPSTCVDLLEKFPVIAVKLFGVDTHNWA